jgi:hypothetical protein
LLTLLYTAKLEEGSLEVDGNFKSMEDVGRRFKDVNLKLPDELVVLMTLMSFPYISRPKEEYCKLNKIFSWRLLRETCDKKR